MKYTLGDSKEVIDPNGGVHTVHQIIAQEVFDIYPVESSDPMSVLPGNKGGWIEKEENLSQEGTCWIWKETSFVVGNARVYEDATIADGCWIMDDAKVHGRASVRFRSIVSGNAEVSGEARVFNHSKVSDSAKVRGNAYLLEYAEVLDKAIVDGDVIVAGNAPEGLRSVVKGRVHITGSVNVNFPKNVHSSPLFG